MSYSSGIDVEIEGVRYFAWKDVVDAYPDNNLHRTLLSQRYKGGKRGLDLIKPKQIQAPKKSDQNIIMNIDGKNYRSLRHLSDSFGISYDTVKKRYSMGIRGKELVDPRRLRYNRVR